MSTTRAPRLRRIGWPALRAAVVLALAALVYAYLIPVTHLDGARIKRIALAHPGVPGLKAAPKSALVVEPVDQPFAALRSAAAASPSDTGAYTVEWDGTKSTNTGAELLVEKLPTTKSATAVAAEARALYLKKTAFSSQSLTLASTFSVPSIPGARAAIFKKAATKKAKGEIEAVVILRAHKTVATVILPQILPEAIPTRASATLLATNEYRHLLALGPGFSLAVTTDPIVATIVYAIVAILLALVAALVPLLVRRTRERRRERQRARERAQYRVRGAKVLKRHARRPLPTRPRRRTVVDWLVGR